ncbi:cupredoxin domain-containing protein [Paenibacillus piri]|nr:cupredoxin domain-containing protein [Paenibacillus piri]
MLLNLGSLILIVLMTGYHVYDGLRQKWESARNGFAPAVALFSGMAFGAVGAQTFDFDLTVTLSIAILFAIVAGFLGGIGFGLQTAVQGALAGSLGAMLGTLTGSLYYRSNNVVLVAAIAFIIISFLLQKLADRRRSNDSRRRNETATPLKKHAPAGTVILAICAAVSAASIMVEKDQIRVGSIGAPASQTAVFDEENDLQVASIDVSASGFTPAVTEFKAGTMIKAVFNVKPNSGTGLKLVSSDLNFSAELKPGQNIFLLNNPQPGTYELVEPNKAYKSMFTVKSVK